MLFSESEIRRVKRTLGYVEFDRTNNSVENSLAVIVDPDRRTEILKLMDSIEQLEDKIQESVTKMQVRKVGEIELDYSLATKYLIDDASRKLHALANLCMLDVMFDKFKGGGKQGGGSGKYSVLTWC